MTERLYFDDPYQTEFEAEVVRRVDWDGKPGVILNQTCFYPTSGGQSCDKGLLNDVAVVDVIDHRGEIVHLTKAAVEAGNVRGNICWERRFDFMQQHAGQHVLSQSVVRVLGADTVSAHLGEEMSSVEIEKEDITEEEIRDAEDFANKIVFENRLIKTYFVSADQAANLALRKIPARKGRIRIVEVEDFDFSACGGTHCRRTGEIGIIKIGRWERIRKHIRLQFLCGGRALADYRWKSEMIERLADRYSAKATDVQHLVGRQAEENKELRRRLKIITEQLMDLEALQLLSTAASCGEFKLVRAVYDRRPFEEVKSLAMRIAQQEPAVVLLGNRTEKGQLVFACSEGLPYKMNELIRDACSEINGSGGGSPILAFGGGPLVGRVEEVLNVTFDQLLKHR